MDVLICENEHNKNEYIKQLADAYKREGCNVVYGVQNFFYSNFAPHILHIQWPEALYFWDKNVANKDRSITNIAERLSFFESKKSKIVYTVHNISPHNSDKKKDYKYFSLIASYADIVVHHGNTSVNLVKNRYPKSQQSQHIICPHGPYSVQNSSLTVAKSREKYGLEKTNYIFLNFGKQWKRKGQRFLDKTFSCWDGKRCTLFSIGPLKNENEPDNFIERFLNRVRSKYLSVYYEFKTRFSSQKRYLFRNVPENEVPDIIKASDVFILGHQKGLNSGIIALAATYGKPLVLPDIGNFREQLTGWEWCEFYEVGDINSAINALERLKAKLNNIEPGDIEFDNRQWLNKNSWSNHVKKILKNVKSE